MYRIATRIFYNTRERHKTTRTSRESNPLPYSQQRDLSQCANHWTTGARDTAIENKQIKLIYRCRHITNFYFNINIKPAFSASPKSLRLRWPCRLITQLRTGGSGFESLQAKHCRYVH